MMSLSGVVTTGEVPLVVEQLVATAPAASGDNSTDTSGRVTISRRRVESMLVDAYREKLSGMTDAELSRLFESEVLREFPSASILGGGEAGGGKCYPRRILQIQISNISRTFVFLCSQVFYLLVSFNYSSRITFWGWGTTSRSLRCSKEQVPVGGGGQLPAP